MVDYRSHSGTCAFTYADARFDLRTDTRTDSSQRSRVRYPVRPHTFVSPSANSRRAVVSYWRKYMHEVVVPLKRCLPRKSVVRLTDRPDMTIVIYHGFKTTTQQQRTCKHAQIRTHMIGLHTFSQS